MKKTKFSKTVSIVLALSFMLSAVFCFGGSAVTSDEITESATVKSVNVEHRDFMHLAFMVEETAEHTGAIGIMIWEADATDYTADNAIYSNYQTSEDSEGNVYYSGNAVPAKNIATDYLVAVVEKNADGNVTVISVPKAYSIKAWATQKIADEEAKAYDEDETTEPDTVRINLYNKVIAYGEAASAVLN